MEKSPIFTYSITPLTSLEEVNKNKLSTLQDILEDYMCCGANLDEICSSIVCWIEAGQKARNTRECAENGLAIQTTDFIEYLYELLTGCKSKIIAKIKNELSKTNIDD